MLLFTFGLFAICALIFWKTGAQHHIADGLAAAWLRIQALYLPSTRITIDHTQLGHIIPVNNDLQLIRHASGRIAYLPVRRHVAQRRPMPRALKALLLTFFTL
ncbi:MAG: hypothetical protein H0X24_08775 [Ktedonobacterales bacterium]|nr:hypothetical protein [Ktedonobacterales bacterium]